LLWISRQQQYNQHNNGKLILRISLEEQETCTATIERNYTMMGEKQLPAPSAATIQLRKNNKSWRRNSSNI
jgi:hypothetical protein